MGQELGRNGFDPFRVEHQAILPLCPFVHGKHTVHIRGGGQHRKSAADPADGPGQVVGPAQVPGQDGDGVPGALIHHHNRRVSGFAFQMGCDGPHGDSRRPDVDQAVTL